ncbi:hypothetical protein FRB95_011617 [Tulasnella sp. JGI-2019a]|nr:hypothetical protein FRB95_011617 [Tulasnella sp. JGI-2019a]
MSILTTSSKCSWYQISLLSNFKAHQIIVSRIGIELRAALDSLGTYQVKYDRLQIDMNNELGRGGFGVVRRAHLGGQVVAAKILRSDESKDIRVAKRLVREMKVWSGLCHPNMLPLIGFLPQSNPGPHHPRVPPNTT